LFHGVFRKMKSLGFILSIVVVLFSAQPLISALAQEKAVQAQNNEKLCCSEQTDCCRNSDRDTEDAGKCGSEQGCTDKCQCVIHSQSVNAITENSAPLNMFGLYIEVHETLSTPYHLILPVSIWHPPQS